VAERLEVSALLITQMEQQPVEDLRVDTKESLRSRLRRRS
jgi:hypothetical protein